MSQDVSTTFVIMLNDRFTRNTANLCVRIVLEACCGRLQYHTEGEK